MDSVVNQSAQYISNFLMNRSKRNDQQFWDAGQWRKFRWCAKALETMLTNSSPASRSLGLRLAGKLSGAPSQREFDPIAAIQRGALMANDTIHAMCLSLLLKGDRLLSTGVTQCYA